jgi:hypothetical protein
LVQKHPQKSLCPKGASFFAANEKKKLATFRILAIYNIPARHRSTPTNPKEHESLPHPTPRCKFHTTFQTAKSTSP